VSTFLLLGGKEDNSAVGGNSLSWATWKEIVFFLEDHLSTRGMLLLGPYSSERGGIRQDYEGQGEEVPLGHLHPFNSLCREKRIFFANGFLFFLSGRKMRLALEKGSPGGGGGGWGAPFGSLPPWGNWHWDF